MPFDLSQFAATITHGLLVAGVIALAGVMFVLAHAGRP